LWCVSQGCPWLHRACPPLLGVCSTSRLGGWPAARLGNHRCPFAVTTCICALAECAVHVCLCVLCCCARAHTAHCRCVPCPPPYLSSALLTRTATCCTRWLFLGPGMGWIDAMPVAECKSQPQPVSLGGDANAAAHGGEAPAPRVAGSHSRARWDTCSLLILCTVGGAGRQ
jgi:hypothetical protein